LEGWHPLMATRVTWFDDVYEALQRLGGRAHLSSIYREVKSIREVAGRSLTKTWENTVRQTLEDHSQASESFRSGKDIFHLPEGKGSGVWAIRK
jgi:hypothetical protein